MQIFDFNKAYVRREATYSDIGVPGTDIWLVAGRQKILLNKIIISNFFDNRKNRYYLCTYLNTENLKNKNNIIII